MACRRVAFGLAKTTANTHVEVAMAEKQTILILNFGGQYTQLIARRVRENKVFSEVVPWDISAEEAAAHQPVGLILSGGPSSVSDPNAPRCDPRIFDLGIPILGICYGMQLTADMLGGRVERAGEREYGRVTVRMAERSGLLHGMKEASSCWMSHTWQVSACPSGISRCRLQRELSHRRDGGR